MNGGAWHWAITLFSDRPFLLSTCVPIYGLGLRHGVDAEHIAAIDNVSRELMGQGQRPIGAGLFSALGHSAVVEDLLDLSAKFVLESLLKSDGLVPRLRHLRQSRHRRPLRHLP